MNSVAVRASRPIWKGKPLRIAPSHVTIPLVFPSCTSNSAFQSPSALLIHPGVAYITHSSRSGLPIHLTVPHLLISQQPAFLPLSASPFPSPSGSLSSPAVTLLFHHLIMGDESENSSDWDFGNPPPNPYADAGKASIERLFNNRIEDRRDSKKAVKHLRYTSQNPQTEYVTYLWVNRMQAYRKHTLRSK